MASVGFVVVVFFFSGTPRQICFETMRCQHLEFWLCLHSRSTLVRQIAFPRNPIQLTCRLLKYDNYRKAVTLKFSVKYSYKTWTHEVYSVSCKQPRLGLRPMAFNELQIVLNSPTVPRSCTL